MDVQKVLESEIKVLNNVLKPVLGESFVNIPVSLYASFELIVLHKISELNIFLYIIF